MLCSSSKESLTFTQGTRLAFHQHLRETPNKRRVTQTDKGTLIEWLTNPHKRPLSQEEFSRRNYVRQTFSWDEQSQSLLAVAKRDEDKARIVITDDKIADVVETVHTDNNHTGWDATWKDISTRYYGILRSDVTFLLKQCQVCFRNPSKRPKGSAATMPQSPETEHEIFDFFSMSEVQYVDPTLDVPRNASKRTEQFLEYVHDEH